MKTNTKADFSKKSVANAVTDPNKRVRQYKKRVQSPLSSASDGAVFAHPTTKRDQLASLLVRDEGATLEQMTALTGWLPHTTRAALTGLKKRGYAIDSDKIDGVRTYRAVAPE